MEGSAEQLPTLPVFLVADVSASMAGGPIDALNASLSAFLKAMQDDEVVGSTVRVSLVTFSDSGRVVLPLSDLADAQLRTIRVEGGTNFAAAFRTVRQAIDDGMSSFPTGTPFYRPVVFFMSDGMHQASEDWSPALADLHDADWKWHPVVVTFGFGDADRDALSTISTGNAFIAESTAPAVAIQEFMHSVTGTIGATSQAIARPGERHGMQLVHPDSFVRIPADGLTTMPQFRDYDITSPQVAYDAATDTVDLDVQPPLDLKRSPVIFWPDPDIELLFDPGVRGRLLGAIVRSPSLARDAAWIESLEGVLGAVLARHVRSVADPYLPPDQRAYQISDTAYTPAVIAEQRLLWRALDDDARALFPGAPVPSGDEGGTLDQLAGIIREALRRGAHQLGRAFRPAVPVAAVRFRGDSSETDERPIPESVAAILGIRPTLWVSPRTGGVVLEVEPYVADPARIAVETDEATIVFDAAHATAPGRLAVVMEQAPAEITLVPAPSTERA